MEPGVGALVAKKTKPLGALSRRMPEWKFEKAKQMRRAPTRSERILWSRLNARQLGVRFRRQFPLLGYIADFASPLDRIVVEVDGGCHDPEADAYRDRVMAAHGITVVRIPSGLVEDDVDRAVDAVREAIARLPKRKVRKDETVALKPKKPGKPPARMRWTKHGFRPILLPGECPL